MQSRLSRLVLCAVLPLVLLVAGIIAADYRAMRDSAAQMAQILARGTALAVERELRTTIVSLEALAMSRSLATGDLDTFRQEAESLAARYFPGSSIALLTFDGQQFFNTFRPPGAALPRRPDLESLDRVRTSKLPSVSDVFMAPLQRQFILTIDVPVFGLDGQLRAVLSLAPPLDTIATVVQEQRPQFGWVVSVLDRKGVIVARAPSGDRYVGRSALTAFRRLLETRSEGTADVIAVDGTSLLAGWSHLGASGWSIAIGIPYARLYPALWRTLAATLAVSVLTLIGALVLARAVAERIARPVEALARYAAEPAHDMTASAPALGLREADAVLAAFRAATRERQAAEARLRELEAESRTELERCVEERTAELQAAQVQLLQSQRMKAIGQLTAGIAHDFNNLLQAQLAGLELLLDCVAGDEQATRYGELAIASCERGAKLTHSLLSFSRQQMLRPAPVRVPALLDQLRELLSRTLDPRIALRVTADADLSPVLADPVHLEAALLNLCLNARDAMREHGGELLMHACEGAAATFDAPDGMNANSFVVISVSDNGEGMDAPTLAHACEPFFTTKGVGFGSGLGLPMAQGFARQSGGELRVRSWLGKGTRVEIWLPRAELRGEAAVDDSEGADNVAGLLLAPAEARGSGRVLLVEDDPAVRELLADVLGQAGLKIAHADNADAALVLLQAGQSFDVLVTDYAMPGITGGELVRQARMSHPRLPALVITGYAQGEQLGQIPSDVTVLRKPFRMDKLATHVSDLIAAAAAECPAGISEWSDAGGHFSPVAESPPQSSACSHPY